MKNLYLIVCLLASPFALSAQNIHGLWSGTLVNDSTHRVQNFELGLSEYRGRITGYTYTTFIDNDTFYYSIKRVRAERKGDQLVIEDVEMVGNNFPQRAAKHVKQTTVFPLVDDTTIDISNGRWTTNQTKIYYSIGGTATIKEQQDEKESDLVGHLQELNVKTDLAARQKEPRKDEPVAKNSPATRPQRNNSKITATKNSDDIKRSQPLTRGNNPSPDADNTQKGSAPNTEVATKKTAITNNPPANENNAIVQNATAKQEPANNNDRSQQNNFANSNKGTTEIEPVAQVQVPEQKKATVQPVVEKKEVVTGNKTQEQKLAGSGSTSSALAQNKNQPVTVDKTPGQKIAGPGSTDAVAQNKSQIVAADKIPEQKAINTVAVNKPSTQNKESIGAVKELPSVVAERKNETIQNIYFKNDSLVLALYDNGIVDGDTVSVFMNGENIVSRQKLKEAATKKTIYISSNVDSVQLVLFAENLGSIPPNTGLLTVRDGDDVYQVRFSADLQKNASIILRRRKGQ